ncbi:M4 family metallopeptidase [Streptomyces sp. NBC_01276]|uniref:M4 family metallopeptidase n=1 Tax=Streptomyces sp. NBC_01276 TaxID=2903808 RepID=UPI00352C5D9E
MSRTRPINCIIPPYILSKLLDSKDREVRQAALDTLLLSARLHGERTVRASFAGAAAPGNSRRTIFDCAQEEFLENASLARTEDGPESADQAVNQAFDALGVARDFYREVFQRNSIDDKGMRLDGYVHFGFQFNNAFWDGQEMVFGDGDGKELGNLAGSGTVTFHECTHGVTDHTAGFEYHNQSGALNESMSDVFGSLASQWSLKQTADEADWLIGAEVWTPGIPGDALRSLKNPGHAYDNPQFGKDPQPDRMSRFVHLPDTKHGDNGGVHFNSGIPNKAFFLTAVRIGGFAWQSAGTIWYESLKASSPKNQFEDFAGTTFLKAGELFGTGSPEQSAVLSAWQEVEVQIRGIPTGVARVRSFAVSGHGHSNGNGHGGASRDDGLASLTRQIGTLTDKVTGLTKEVTAMKSTR